MVKIVITIVNSPESTSYTQLVTVLAPPSDATIGNNEGEPNEPPGTTESESQTLEADNSLSAQNDEPSFDW